MNKITTKNLKATFRCALHSLPDVEKVENVKQTKGDNACRVYKFKETKPTYKKRKSDSFCFIALLKHVINFRVYSTTRKRKTKQKTTEVHEKPPSLYGRPIFTPIFIYAPSYTANGLQYPNSKSSPKYAKLFT